MEQKEKTKIDTSVNTAPIKFREIKKENKRKDVEEIDSVSDDRYPYEVSKSSLPLESRIDEKEKIEFNSKLNKISKIKTTKIKNKIIQKSTREVRRNKETVTTSNNMKQQEETLKHDNETQTMSFKELEAAILEENINKTVNKEKMTNKSDKIKPLENNQNYAEPTGTELSKPEKIKVEPENGNQIAELQIKDNEAVIFPQSTENKPTADSESTIKPVKNGTREENSSKVDKATNIVDCACGSPTTSLELEEDIPRTMWILARITLDKNKIRKLELIESSLNEPEHNVFQESNRTTLAESDST